MKKIITLLMVLFLFNGCGASSDKAKDDSLDSLLERDMFIIGFTEYPPFGSLNQGVASGFDIDMAEEVAKRLGVSFDTKYIDWDSKQFELDNGNIDAIWNGFTITPKRAEGVTFTKPYFDNHIVMMSLKGNTYNDLEDLEGKLVGVELQSSGQIALEEREDVYSSIKEMMKYTSVSEALMALNTEGIDVIVVDENFARYITSKDQDLYEISSARFNPENYGVGLRKGSLALAEKIDEIIDEMIKDGSAGKISEKWFGKDMISR
ncbi:MAG: transporter substrate-binding domain-containing protein [Clostridium sp.]|nr:transporter substrate-binding domain-containing protein [Clostridium sp.]